MAIDSVMRHRMYFLCFLLLEQVALSYDLSAVCASWSSSSSSSCRMSATRIFGTARGDPSTSPTSTIKPEEQLNLAVSIESRGFLKNIIEYGNNRMARRAVGVLQKMPAYRVYPTEEHYTQAIWACEKSDQFALAMSVFEEMKTEDVPRTVSTYEALISVAEKTKHFDEAVALFEDMKRDGLRGTTEAYNACILALDRTGRPEDAFALLQEMEALGVTCDETTFTACMGACEKAGEGDLALRLLDKMTIAGLTLSTPTYNNVLWACVKGGYWEDALRIFREMDEQKVTRNVATFNAAIWAAEIGGDPVKAVQFLRMMKFEGNQRDTMAFDGTISALAKAGDWAQMMEVLEWMQRDEVNKSPVTYKIAIECLDQNGHDELIGELYLKALRDGYFSPWIKRTRRMDLRGFTYGIAKIATKTVLLSMIDGKLDVFSLNITVADVVPDTATGHGSEFLSSFDVDAFHNYLSTLNLKNNGVEAQAHEGELLVKRIVEDNTERLVIDREDLVTWVERHKEKL